MEKDNITNIGLINLKEEKKILEEKIATLINTFEANYCVNVSITVNRDYRNNINEVDATITIH